MHRFRIAAALLALAAVAGCGLRRDKVMAPAAGAPPIQGTLARAGAPVAGWTVKLYDDATGALAESTLTGAGGGYGFAGVPAGHWMVKASSTLPGDFGYVRWFFDSTGPSTAVIVPPFDLSARGMDAQAPADSALVPVPNPAAPLHFQWTPYQGTYAWANARVTDTLDVQLWASAQGTATSADWNGVLTGGPDAGQLAGPGVYQWRVKIHLGNGLQAASRQRTFFIMPTPRART